MKYNAKFIPLILVTFASCSCASTTPQPVIHYFSKDEHVLDVSRLGYITGPEADFNTMEAFTLGSCDLGYPLYIPEKEQMWYFFGDTFTQNHQTGGWKSNVVGISTDFNYSDGLIIDDCLTNSAGYLKAVINGHHTGDHEYEVTKIPTGVIYVNNTIYMYFFSMYDWTAPNDVRMNFGGCVKSTDYGQNWERVYDLTWANFSPDGTYGSTNSKENISTLINEDISNTPRTENLINIEDHYGYDAVMIYPMMGNDGYVYLFIESGYRNHPLKLARVTSENIEKFDEIEYMQGYDEHNNPTYIKGYEGLKALYQNNEAQITEYNFGEMSGIYNPYLKKWCLTTSTTGGVRICMSDRIEGPYKESMLIYTAGDEICPISSTTGEPIFSAYAPMLHEKMLEDDGKTMYMISSTWIPCYNPSLYKITLK